MTSLNFYNDFNHNDKMCYFCNCMKITEQQIAELLISSSPEGILVINQYGEILMVNESLISMFRYANANELINKQMEILIPNRFEKSHIKNRSNFHENPEKRRMGTDKVLYARRKDGTEFAVEVGLNYIKSDDGILITALISDISERIKIQEKLQLLNKELESKVVERTKELENAILELQETYQNLETQFEKTKIAEFEAKKALEKEKELGELKSRFVSMASHEFRTPLSTVLSSNSLINKYLEKSSHLDDETKDKVNKHNKRIDNSIKNLNEILNDLLSIGKIEEGKISTKNDPFCIETLLSEIKEEMSTYLKPNQQLIITHTGKNNVITDRHLLNNILLNLISNASKYSNEGKEIKVTSVYENNNLNIKIIDQGIGIPIADHNHMFERFFRAKNATNIQGTGLGLNIVKKYIELMNGTITFTSELNVGSTFIINLQLNNNAN